MVSTGASSEDLIWRIPSRTFSQLAGGSPVSNRKMFKGTYDNVAGTETGKILVKVMLNI